jgi:hypothetical protein
LVHGPLQRDTRPHDELGNDRHGASDVHAELEPVRFDHDAADVGPVELGRARAEQRATDQPAIDQPAIDQPASDFTSDDVSATSHDDHDGPSDHHDDDVGWRGWRGVLNDSFRVAHQTPGTIFQRTRRQ